MGMNREQAAAVFVERLITLYGLSPLHRHKAQADVEQLMASCVQLGAQTAGIIIQSITEDAQGDFENCPLKEQHSPERGTCPMCGWVPGQEKLQN